MMRKMAGLKFVLTPRWCGRWIGILGIVEGWPGCVFV